MGFLCFLNSTLLFFFPNLLFLNIYCMFRVCCMLRVSICLEITGNYFYHKECQREYFKKQVIIQYWQILKWVHNWQYKVTNKPKKCRIELVKMLDFLFFFLDLCNSQHVHTIQARSIKKLVKNRDNNKLGTFFEFQKPISVCNILPKLFHYKIVQQ